MRSRWLFAVVVLAGLAVAACGSTSDVDPGDDNTIDDGTNPPPPEVDGTSWVLVAGGGPAGDIVLIDGYPVTITFDGDVLGGTASCNGYGGTYSLDGNSLAIAELSQNEMACEPPEAMVAESAYLAALVNVDELSLVGAELVLGGSAAELVFTRQAEIPTAALIGQTWVLETLIQGETASSVGGDPATLLLDADGTVVGSTGCRTLSGEYVLAGASVQFVSFSAEGDCPADLVTQDDIVVTVLGDGFRVEIDGDQLTLTSLGNEGLVYRVG